MKIRTVIKEANLTKPFMNNSGTTVFTRLSAAALFKFSELQMRRSFGGGNKINKF